MNKKFSMIIGVFFSFMISCTANNVGNSRIDSAKMIEPVPLDSLLEKIDRDLKGVFDPPIQLYTVRNFSFLYNNSGKYLNDIIKVMRSDKYSYNKKLICVYAVQKIDLQEYLRFSRYCLNLLNKDIIKEDIFYFVILPIGWNTDIRFAENYQNEDVSNFLKELLKSQKISDRLKSSISRIASGEMLKSRRKMID